MMRFHTDGKVKQTLKSISNQIGVSISCIAGVIKRFKLNKGFLYRVKFRGRKRSKFIGGSKEVERRLLCPDVLQKWAPLSIKSRCKLINKLF